MCQSTKKAKIGTDDIFYYTDISKSNCIMSHNMAKKRKIWICKTAIKWIICPKACWLTNKQ